MATRRELTEAAEALAAQDVVMARLVRRHGPPTLRRPTVVRSRFESLARAICFQQLAGVAATAIWDRIRLSVGGETLTPSRVLALGEPRLRAAGLSGAKAASMLDLAKRVDQGAVRLDRIGRLTDPEIVDELVQVRGIGPWTAEMFLIFDLHRLDVWPVTDYGVRNGYARAHGMTEKPTPRELDELGERYRPYRSIAAWYCWRAVDG